MKKNLRKLTQKLGVLPYIQVFKERYFPTEYVKEAIKGQKKYLDFYSQFINKGDLCFDIGANIGHRTEIFLKLGAKVVAVEPQKDLFRYLKIKYKNKIQLENCGLGSGFRVQTMFINDASALSTFSDDMVKNSRFSDTEWINKRQVQIKTLDSLIEKYGVPQFCKIDVEGYEYEVLSGLSKKIPYTSIEFALPENLQVLKDSISHIINLTEGAEFNYALGDDMVLASEKWFKAKNIQEFYNEKIFRESSWGDVYMKMK
jgi:FkbM family methyltransferase